MNLDPEPPEDRSAEKSIIACFLLQPGDTSALIGRLRPEDFFHQDCRNLFLAITDLLLEGQPISLASVAHRARVPATDVGQWLAGVDTGDAIFWADRVRDLARRRGLLQAGLLALESVHSVTPVDTSYARVTSLLQEDQRDALAAAAIDASVDSVLSRLSRFVHEPGAISGLPTGWAGLDTAIDGLEPGSVSCVYGPTSQYKSFFVTNIAWRVAQQGTPVLFFSTEMPEEQVILRLLQLESGINIRRARRNRELFMHMEELQKSGSIIRAYPLYICDHSVLDVNFVSALSQRAAQSKGVKLIVIDLLDHVYSQRFSDAETKNESYVMLQLKNLAKRTNTHVLLTSHVAKPDRDMRRLNRPILEVEEMKGSSSKGQDADVAISLMQVAFDPEKHDWRATTHQERALLADNEFVTIMVAVTKNRHGERRDFVFRVQLDKGGVIQDTDS